VAKSAPYVQAIMKAALAFESRSSDNLPPKKVIIELEDPLLLSKLHRLKADKGFRSLNKFFNHLIVLLTKGY